ncbi:MAG: hypothetical protein HY355_04495 [Armatimonadetes bacterium]|nr:hypothetical protein [Armatimonadota bacterium]
MLTALRQIRASTVLAAAAGAGGAAVLRTVVETPGSINYRILALSVPVGVGLSYALERAYVHRRVAGGIQAPRKAHFGRWQWTVTGITVGLAMLEQVGTEVIQIISTNEYALTNWIMIAILAGLLTFLWMAGAPRRTLREMAVSCAIAGWIGGSVVPPVITRIVLGPRSPMRMEWVPAFFWALSGVCGGLGFSLAWRRRVPPLTFAAIVVGALIVADQVLDVALARVPSAFKPTGFPWAIWVPIGWGLGLFLYPPSVPADATTDAPAPTEPGEQSQTQTPAG